MVAIALCPNDKSSFANTSEAIVKHMHMVLQIDFEEKKVKGHVDYTLVQSAQRLVLDSRNLTIQRVCDSQGKEIPFEVIKVEDFPEVFGTPLQISNITTPTVTVYYETTSNSEAIQFLSKEQTVGKDFPFLFTQCEAVHARSLLPCQDTPSVKSTYSAEVTCVNPMVVLMSALREGNTQNSDNTITYRFKQPISIPSYLIALACGKLVSRSVGPRSSVWSEEKIIEQCAWEFSQTEEYLKTAESFLIPYQWGIYDLLILPSSFPFGGMENPICTYVTPTLLAGDRSLTNVVAHEIAHSWSGNLVTNATWEDFWLNEGFTVYIERRIVAKMTKSEKEADFHALLGRQALSQSIQHYKEINMLDLTAMIPKLDKMDPDDAFSSVPYEKGFNFLYYLAKLVGGHDAFEPFLQSYFSKFANTTVSSQQMKEHFVKFYTGKVEQSVLDGIEWDRWFTTPGDLILENQFDTSLADEAKQLAQQWMDKQTVEEASHFSSWPSNQKCFFLDHLYNNFSKLSIETLQKMDSLYKLSDTKNSEIRFRWQLLCIKLRYTEIYPQVVEFITSQGRMKFTRPLYRALYQNGGDAAKLARDTFVKNRHVYHLLCAKMVARDLEL